MLRAPYTKDKNTERYNCIPEMSKSFSAGSKCKEKYSWRVANEFTCNIVPTSTNLKL